MDYKDVYIINTDDDVEDYFEELYVNVGKKKIIFYGTMQSCESSRGVDQNNIKYVELNYIYKLDNNWRIRTDLIKEDGTKTVTDINLTKLGNGTKFLSDDGTYKEIPAGSDNTYILNLNEYTTADDFTALKEAIDAGKVIIGNIGVAVPQVGDGTYIDIYTLAGLSVQNGTMQIMSMTYRLKSDGTYETISGAAIALDTSGDGTKYLADDGNYRTLDVSQFNVIDDDNLSAELFTEIYNNLQSDNPKPILRVTRSNNIPYPLLCYALGYIGEDYIWYGYDKMSGINGNLSVVGYSEKFKSDGTLDTSYYLGPVIKTDGNGKKFLGDDGQYYEIVSSESTKETITFTLDNIVYTAEKGMTFAQWVDSSYNTDGYYYDKANLLLNSDGFSCTEVSAYYIIVADSVYKLGAEK